MATAQKHQPNHLTSPREMQPRTNLGRGEATVFTGPLSGMQKHQTATPTHLRAAQQATPQASRQPQPQKSNQLPTLPTRCPIEPRWVKTPLPKPLALTLAILAVAFSLNASIISTTPPICTPKISALYKAVPTLNTVAENLIGALHDTLQSRPGNLHQQTRTRRERGTAGGGPGRRPQQGRAGSQTRPAKQGHASWTSAVEPARQAGSRTSGRDALSTPRQGATRKRSQPRQPQNGVRRTAQEQPGTRTGARRAQGVVGIRPLSVALHRTEMPRVWGREQDRDPAHLAHASTLLSVLAHGIEVTDPTAQRANQASQRKILTSTPPLHRPPGLIPLRPLGLTAFTRHGEPHSLRLFLIGGERQRCSHCLPR